ncbi:cytochrome b/b6 domain-containing protein [Roseovarius sp. SK2]|uniref:cytochrome b/b6 domain-containing protein n=1 Tax=Roseovarius TaxID=74030 RepID=UPI00237BB1DE|nr:MULTISPECIES: cytochrome b/b6 domain-containing protein [unclassified Roseovarius]MDD9724125.1 cytochrome b/b6 domain-containing protein [Roseovarius sp. SK2]
MTRYKVWDPAIRVFHWALAAGFIANAFLIDDDAKLHEWVGYGVMALVGLRILWGFIGPRHARFASFIPGPGGVTRQITDMALRRRRTHLGHSPLGALMIGNLLLSMLAIGATGYLMTTNAFWGVEWVEEAHEAFVLWAELSVLAHVAAVVLESLRTGVNLPRAMITGCKTVPDDVKLES